MRTAIRSSLLVSLVAGLLSAAPTAVGSPDCAVVNSETYKLQITPRKVHYDRGDTATIAIKVTRAGTDQAVQGAKVTAALYQPSTKSYAPRRAGKTDSRGVALADIKVARYFERGRMDVMARAETEHVDAQTACADASEWGFKHKKRAFHVGR